jgi:signal transduction histidine kinase
MKLGSLLKPTNIEVMPALRRRLLYLCSVAVHGLAASSALVLLLTLVLWPLTSPTWKALTVGVLLSCLVALWVVRRSSHSQWRQAATLLALQSCLLGLSLQPWALGQPVPMLHTSMIAVPLLLGAIIPMTPAWNAASGALATLGLALGYLLAPPFYMPHLSYILVTLPPVALMGWVSGVQRRRVWGSLHRQQRQLHSADRLTQLGRRTASIAHELKSPLAAALNTLAEAQRLQEELAMSVDHPEVTQDDLREIAAELAVALQHSQDNFGRMDDFLSSLQRQSSYQGAGASAARNFSVRQRLEGLLQMYQQEGSALSEVVRVTNIPETLQLRGDPVAFDRIMMNLLENAQEASGVGDAVELRFQLQGSQGQLLVVDQGHGVPEGMRESIFEAMVTTRARLGHTGLGLSLCRDMARGVFGGDVLLVPSHQGATFALTSPWFAYAGRPTLKHTSKITPLAQVR